MWIFDEDKDMTNTEVISFAQEGGADAVRHFPSHILNNKENMLALIENGFGYIALSYCSKDLKQDMDFLKQAASHYHYTAQKEFFNKMNPELKNNKELLDIFAAKLDEPNVKQSNNEKNQLDKILNQSMATQSTTKVKYRI